MPRLSRGTEDLVDDEDGRGTEDLVDDEGNGGVLFFNSVLNYLED